MTNSDKLLFQYKMSYENFQWEDGFLYKIHFKVNSLISMQFLTLYTNSLEMSPLNLVDFNPAMTFKLLGKYTNQKTKRSNVQKPKEKGHIF